MLKSFRQRLVNSLWQHHHAHSSQVTQIVTALKQKGLEPLTLDHFAAIDLPGPHTGIAEARDILACIGYVERGRGYLADKQNDFCWLAEEDSEDQLASAVLPQIVVADFRLDEMPLEIKKIIEKYAAFANPTPLATIQKLANGVTHNDSQAAEKLHALLLAHFAGRDWPLPAYHEFQTVQAFNELLAWVLVFGRRPNHFTLSIHLLDYFANLEAFNQFITSEVKLELNHEGGVIKGGQSSGIAQSSTVGTPCAIALPDGNVELPTEFVEFVFRYPRTATISAPPLWKDFFPDFVGEYANHVIESLYELEKNNN